MGGFIQNIPGVSVGDSGYTPSGLATDANTATASQGSIWSQVGGFVTDLGNLGLNIYHQVSVPQTTVPKTTLPQASTTTATGLFGGGLASLLLIGIVIVGGLFVLKKVR